MYLSLEAPQWNVAFSSVFCCSGTLMLQLDGFPTGDGVKVTPTQPLVCSSDVTWNILTRRFSPVPTLRKWLPFLWAISDLDVEVSLSHVGRTPSYGCCSRCYGNGWDPCLDNSSKTELFYLFSPPCVCVCACAQADRSAGRLTGSMMELQTLQEALKVEIQIHQVRLLFRATGSVGQGEQQRRSFNADKSLDVAPSAMWTTRQEVVSTQTKTSLWFHKCQSTTESLCFPTKASALTENQNVQPVKNNFVCHYSCHRETFQ